MQDYVQVVIVGRESSSHTSHSRHQTALFLLRCGGGSSQFELPSGLWVASGMDSGEAEMFASFIMDTGWKT